MTEICDFCGWHIMEGTFHTCTLSPMDTTGGYICPYCHMHVGVQEIHDCPAFRTPPWSQPPPQRMEVQLVGFYDWGSLVIAMNGLATAIEDMIDFLREATDADESPEQP